MILYLCVGAILGVNNSYYDVIVGDSSSYSRVERIVVFSATLVLWFPVLILVEIGSHFVPKEEGVK